MEERLILVDDGDVETGVGLKMDVHFKGLRHRAFSVFLWNDKGELLLQRRAPTKYHSAGQWANTCCGHPRPGEQVKSAARRRLGEELGVDADLFENGTYGYTARMTNELVENELVHLFSGHALGDPVPNPEEVDLLKWVAPEDLLADFAANPGHYAPWFALYLSEIPSRIFKLPRAA